MSRTAEKPVAVRAVAFMARSWWEGRPHRRVSYDAWWADGHVETGVTPSSVMQLRHPADIADAEEAVHRRCSQVGPGRWCDDRGRLVRLVAGLVALVLGVVLLGATPSDGPLALVGLLCLGLAVGALSDFVPPGRRWW